MIPCLIWKIRENYDDCFPSLRKGQSKTFSYVNLKREILARENEMPDVLQGSPYL
jgi:hypothetical protein